MYIFRLWRSWKENMDVKKWEEYMRMHEFNFREKIKEEDFIERLSFGPAHFFLNTFKDSISDLAYAPGYGKKIEVVLAGDYGLFMIYSSYLYREPEYIFRISIDFRHVYQDISEWYYKNYLSFISALEKEIKLWEDDKLKFYFCGILPGDVFSTSVNVDPICTVEYKTRPEGKL